MDITDHLKNLTNAALVSGAVAVASLGLGGRYTPTPVNYHWCPGDPPAMGVAPDANG